MKLSAADIIQPLQELIDAQKLLDRLLSYYDVYSGQFEKIPSHDVDYGPSSLNTAIRDYIKFDDSE